MCTISVQPKPFRYNTYGPLRICCKQRTCAVPKSLRCNTYKKHGVGRGERLYYGPGFHVSPLLRRNLGSRESIVCELPILEALCLEIHTKNDGGCAPHTVREVDFRLSTFDFRLSTFDFRLSTFDFRLSTFDFRLSTFDFQL